MATSTLAWGVNTPAHLVIIKGTEFFDALTRQASTKCPVYVLDTALQEVLLAPRLICRSHTMSASRAQALRGLPHHGRAANDGPRGAPAV